MLSYEPDIKKVYNIGKFLGEGQFGKVHLATRVATGGRCALKKMSKQKIKSEGL